MNSWWKANINNKISVCASKDTKKLAVLLPGINYSTDRPLIDYSKRLVMELNYDALAIDYGFQVSRKQFNKEREVPIIIEESYEILVEALNCIDKKYSEILFIGKSIGTVVQVALEKRLKEELKNIKFTNIYLTPIEKTYQLGMSKALVICGTNDTWISKDTIDNIKNNKNIKLVIIEKANHSLNIDGDILESIDIIKNVINLEKQYINI